MPEDHAVPRLPGNGRGLDALGCNVALVRGSERVSLHFPGADSLRRVAEHCDLGGWKVATISTPRTIYRDLQGSRERLNAEADKTNRSTATYLPESKMLGAIGRKDLLA